MSTLAAFASVLAAAGEPLPEEAIAILQARCYRCHGGAGKAAGLDVSDFAVLIDKEETFISPGDTGSSTLIRSFDNDYMPQAGSPEAEEMTGEERDLLRRWVDAGAKLPGTEKRDFVSETDILLGMRDYLLETPADDRRSIRFFTLTHLHNNPRVSPRDLRLYRAALSKALNSLTKRREVTLPRAVPGTSETVYAINLRELGWDRRGRWNDILSFYPYGVKYDFAEDQTLQQAWKDVAQFSGADLPYVRADWFVVTATRPPLYHWLLDLPETLVELEHELQLDIEQNFLHGEVARSGYAKSGVSQQNRLVERHTSPATPYFWISYDFLAGRARGDLARFPLGPAFPGNPFNNQAFDHDGGEVIWSLPNGMQGYLLVDGKGGRIDAGPVDVVFDRSAVLGSPEIINGVSCMYCHRKGMISNFRDELRDAGTLGGRARDHLREVYPPHEEMQRLLQQDEDLFTRALRRVIGPYLLVGEDADKELEDFPEPVGRVAEMYHRDLTPQELALELGYERKEDLQARILASRELLRFGLGTMAQDPPGTLKRNKWETRDGTSFMQDVANELSPGNLPFVPPRN